MKLDGWAVAQSSIHGTTVTLIRLKKPNYVSMYRIYAKKSLWLDEPPIRIFVRLVMWSILRQSVRLAEVYSIIPMKSFFNFNSVTFDLLVKH